MQAWHAWLVLTACEEYDGVVVHVGTLEGERDILHALVHCHGHGAKHPAILLFLGRVGHVRATLYVPRRRLQRCVRRLERKIQE